MPSFFAFMQRNGHYIGLAFTAVVVGLLVYLHVFGQPVVPKPRTQASAVPDLLVCEGEIPWVTDEVVDKVRTFWKEHGHPIGPMKRVPCGSLGTCMVSEERILPCSRGNIVVALRDQQFDEEHAGETVYVVHRDTGMTDWATILLPNKILPPAAPPGADLDEAPLLPLDVEALVLAHEIGHWFGYEHVTTDLPGPFFAEPTGHLMTRGLQKLGWGDAGLGKESK